MRVVLSGGLLRSIVMVVMVAVMTGTGCAWAESTPAPAPATPSQGDSAVNGTPSTATCHNWTSPPKTTYQCWNCVTDTCGSTDCPPGSSTSGKSIIDNTNIDYQHDAVDFRAAALDQGGCAACGSAAGPWGDVLEKARMPALTIARVHRPLDVFEHSSFGPGVFWEYDFSLQFTQSAGVWSGSLFMPHQHRALTFQVSGDRFVDGTYNAFRDLILETALQQVTTDPSAASTAVLTTWEGVTYTFELVAPLGGGRLIRMADRNQNALTIRYQVPESAVVVDPALLWEVATVSDAYGRQASFTYGLDPIAGSYPITRIDVPGGQHISYQYSDPALLSLSGVLLPDGTASWFTSRLDPATQCQVYSFFDAAAKPLERRRDVYLSLGQWMDPTTQVVEAVSPNHVRMVLNGAGEVTYLDWGIMTPQFDQQAYVYEGGHSLFRFTTFLGFPVCTERALDWNLDTDPGSWSWELSAAFRTNGEKYTTMTADALGRTTQTPFDAVTSTRPSTTYPDGSLTSLTFNGFRQPLQSVDELGRISSNQYDSQGNLLSRTRALGSADQATWSWTYSPRGQPLTMTDPNHHTTSYQYSAEGYLVGAVEPPDVVGGVANTWSMGYDAIGNRIAVTDPAGRLVTTAYDSRNRPVLVSYLDGSSETTTYGSGVDANLPIATSDRNGNQTLMSYDGDGRETLRVLAAGTAVQDRITTSYLSGTALRAQQVTCGDTIDYAYDYQNRLVATTTAPTTQTHLTSSTSFDAASQPVVTSDPYGRRIARAFDLRGRVLRTAQEIVPGALPSDQELIDAIPDPQDAPWTFQDLGSPAVAGSISTQGDLITITGIGSEMWSDTEQFSLADQTLVGDGSITVRVVSQQDTDPWAKAGVMMRSSDAPGAAYAALFLSPGHGVSVNDRAATSLDTTYEPVSTAGGGIWLRLERHGTDVLASTSPNGVDWTLGNETTVGFGAEIRIGLFVLAHQDAATCTAVFDHLAVERASDQSQAVLLALTQEMVLGLTRGASADVIIEESSYDPAGEVVAVQDGRGITTTASFDGQGRQVQQTRAAGSAQAATTLTTFDALGNAISVSDPLGRLSTRVYSQRNLLLSQTDAAGLPEALTTTHTYSPTGTVQTTTTPLGTTSFAYGPCCDRLVQVTDEAGFQTSSTYDAVGNRTTLTDGNGITTSWSYDARNRLHTATDGAGDVTTITYDDHLNDGQGIDASLGAFLSDLPLGPGADGSAVLTTDPLGHASCEVFDGIGRLIRHLDGMHHATTTSYDLVIGGLVDTAIQDAVGNVTHRRTDAHDRLRLTLDGEGQPTTIGYDADDNRIRSRDPNQVGTDWSYDQLNRWIVATDTVGATTLALWDAVGNQVGQQDALGQLTTTTYDGLNRRISTTDRIGATTRFTYDAIGNLLTITDAEGGRTAYRYDPRSLLIQDSFPGAAGGSRQYTYDGGRRLTSRLDQAGVITRYRYDPANRLLARSYPDQATDDFTYDAAGRLVSAHSARYDNTVLRAYDDANRVTNEGLVVVADAITHSTVRYDVFYGYDNADRMTLLSYPDGTQSLRRYTPRDQLLDVSYAGASVAQRGYDAGGRLLTTRCGNGLLETRAYRFDNLLQTIGIPGVTGLSYQYDLDKRVLEEDNQVAPEEQQTFAYDAEGRLIHWQQGVIHPETQSWALSAVGDWTATTRNGHLQTRSHNAVHEITAIDHQAVAYDLKGNLTRDPQAELRLGWDQENRLTRAAGDGHDAHYVYDALGRRVRKTVAGITTTFVSAGYQVIWETDTDQAVYQRFAANGGPPTAARPLGGVLSGDRSGDNVLRIAFTTPTAPTPTGFHADTGAVLGVRAGGLTYGWVGAPQPWTRAYDVMPLPPYNGNDALQVPAHADGVWQVALPDGSYPVIVVMGDAAHRDMVNNITISGTPFLDPHPDLPGEPSQYEQGRFVGYALQAQVHQQTLRIATLSSAVNARICFLEIGARGSHLTPEDAQRLQTLVARMTEATAGTPPKLATRAYVYGSYVDEPLELLTSAGAFYYASNRQFSVAALTDATQHVRERYRYDASGALTVLRPNGTATTTGTTVGNYVGFTGRYLDAETSLWYVRTRYESPTLGRFIARDPGIQLQGHDRPRIDMPAPVMTAVTAMRDRVASTPWRGAGPYAGMGYQDGLSLYRAYFVPGNLDPLGLKVLFSGPIACGLVTVESPEGKGGLSLSFTPDTRGAGCCCQHFGWAQHGGISGGGGYRWDNGARGGAFARFGAPSDPQLPVQPTGANGTDNPWYGGPAGPDGVARPNDGQPVDNDEWAHNPRPQNSMYDDPEGGGPYIAQLLCVDSGAVLFEWQYTPGHPGSRRNPPKP